MPDVESRITRLVSLGKDLVALLRDGALVVLAFLLVVFPNYFNAMLVNAGFQEGNVAGFTWKAGLIESNTALQVAKTTISELQGKNEELSKMLGETKARLNDPTLDERVARLQQENLDLKDATQQAQTRVTQALESNKPLLAQVSPSTAAPRPHADYSVGLQTLGFTDDERHALNDQIRDRGYMLDPQSDSYPADKRPDWFARRPTVLYYAPTSRQAANELAQLMKTLTGREFAVQVGAGYGLDPARKDITLFVHYLKK